MNSQERGALYTCRRISAKVLVSAAAVSRQQALEIAAHWQRMAQTEIILSRKVTHTTYIPTILYSVRKKSDVHRVLRYILSCPALILYYICVSTFSQATTTNAVHQYIIYHRHTRFENHTVVEKYGGI